MKLYEKRGYLSSIDENGEEIKTPTWVLSQEGDTEKGNIPILDLVFETAEDHMSHIRKVLENQ